MKIAWPSKIKRGTMAGSCSDGALACQARRAPAIGGDAAMGEPAVRAVNQTLADARTMGPRRPKARAERSARDAITAPRKVSRGNTNKRLARVFPFFSRRAPEPNAIRGGYPAGQKHPSTFYSFQSGSYAANRRDDLRWRQHCPVSSFSSPESSRPALKARRSRRLAAVSLPRR